MRHSTRNVHKAVLAASALSAEGIEAEIIDLRTLVPLDSQTVLRSVAKTGRLLVVDEDYLNFGLTGEMAAVVAEHLDEFELKAPLRRLGVPAFPFRTAARWSNGSFPPSSASPRRAAKWWRPG